MTRSAPRERGAEPVALVINPGSTSTRLALYRGAQNLAEEEMANLAGAASGAPGAGADYEDRLRAVRLFLERSPVAPGDLAVVVGRGGLLRPLEGGVYRINDAMLSDASAGLQGQHPSNLGCLLADAVARPLGLPAYVVDPVSVDESEVLAAYSGLAGIRRRTLSHALSVHACARRHARETGRDVGDMNFIVAHLGGGISVCPVRGGRIVDANNAVSEGPFSPQRSGGLPLQELFDFMFSGGHDLARLRELTTREGGLFSYLGTADAREVEQRIADGDAKADRAYRAMAYQIAKEIGAMATVLDGRVDAVLLTGGLVRSDMLTRWITERVQFIAPVHVIPIQEMQAMATRALAVLRGDEPELEY